MIHGKFPWHMSCMELTAGLITVLFVVLWLWTYAPLSVGMPTLTERSSTSACSNTQIWSFSYRTCWTLPLLLTPNGMTNHNTVKRTGVTSGMPPTGLLWRCWDTRWSDTRTGFMIRTWRPAVSCMKCKPHILHGSTIRATWPRNLFITEQGNRPKSVYKGEMVDL